MVSFYNLCTINLQRTSQGCLYIFFVLLLWCVVALGAPSISMTKTIPFYSAQMGLFSKAKVIFSSVVFICKMIKKIAK